MGRRKGIPRNQRYTEPYWTFFNKGQCALTVKDWNITINTTVEDASVALAEAILKYKKENPTASSKVWGPIQVNFGDGQVSTYITSTSAIDTETWDTLRKNVEKVCNNLKAFM